ncbi:hypothetical protein MHYP_G00242240 [Metynnis hypsauchen]
MVAQRKRTAPQIESRQMLKPEAVAEKPQFHDEAFRSGRSSVSVHEQEGVSCLPPDDRWDRLQHHHP